MQVPVAGLLLPRARRFKGILPIVKKECILKTKSMDHYLKLAARYDEYYRYSDRYIAYFTDKIIKALPVRPGESVVELGAGTCIFAQEILKRVPYLDMVCVDNSAAMLRSAEHTAIKRVCRDAVCFAAEDTRYHRVYMKEFIHHLDTAAREELFKGLYRQLYPGGSLLILMEPRRLNYPLFDEALRRFEQGQPSRTAIMAQLEQAGFTVSFDVFAYPINLSRQKYTEMVRNRYMSVLETFTADELEAGIQSITERQPETELEYLESFYGIVGKK